MTKNQPNYFLAFLLIFITAATIAGALFYSKTHPSSWDVRMKKFAIRNGYESKARSFAESGKLDESIELYKKATDPLIISEEHQKSTAVGAMTEVLKWQSKYSEAKKAYAWFLRHEKPTSFAIQKDHELDALIKFQKNSDVNYIRQYIEEFKAFWLKEKSFPPEGYEVMPVSELLRLYDIIGDYDSGIAFVNKCIDYFHQQKAYVGEVFVEPIEFLKIREAFEQDKAEGKKGCVGKKPGEVCLGRATKAIIQSDYFPW